MIETCKAQIYISIKKGTTLTPKSDFRVSPSHLSGFGFLAPTGAQGVTMSVRPSVRHHMLKSTQCALFSLRKLQANFKQTAVNLHLSRSVINQRLLN